MFHLPPATGSSPHRHALNVHPEKPHYVLEDMFRADDDELVEGVSSSPPRERGEPEIIEVVSDEEDEDGGGEEEDLQEDDGFIPQDNRDEIGALGFRPPLYIQRDDAPDDDVLPGSSPILSSPVEPEHSFPPENGDSEVFDVDELDGGEIYDDEERMCNLFCESFPYSKRDTESKPFDWDHPPAFSAGVPASGPGHLATPVEVEDFADSDEYSQLEVFGTSDNLPTFKSLSQVQTDSEADVLQFEEGSKSGLAEEYFVTEADEDERDPDNPENTQAYTISRSISVDPPRYTVEESFTDHEPDDRGVSIDIVTVDGDVEMVGSIVAAAASDVGSVDESVDDTDEPTSPLGQSPEVEPSEDVGQEKVQVQAWFTSPQVSEAAHELETSLTTDFDLPARLGESRTVGDGGSFLHDGIPMPVLADPTVHDRSAPQPPITPPHVPMVLSLPGSPLLLSPVATPAGQPTPVSLPVPASLLKAMHVRQGSSLFTPPSETPTAEATHQTAIQATQAAGESPGISPGYFDVHRGEDTTMNPDLWVPFLIVELILMMSLVV
jgi:hypothetical protein